MDNRKADNEEAKFKIDPITAEEWHTWWLGFFLASYENMPKPVKAMVDKEYWYWHWGRFTAKVFWFLFPVGIAYLIKVLFFG